MTENEFQYWFNRGKEDARKGRAKALRSTTRFGILAESDDCDWSNEELQEKGSAYLTGYDSYI